MRLHHPKEGPVQRTIKELPSLESYLSTHVFDDQSRIRKRSVVIAGHRTSISLENIFWEQLRRSAIARGVSVNQLVTAIDAKRSGNLSSAIRTFILQSHVSQCGEFTGPPN